MKYCYVLGRRNIYTKMHTSTKYKSAANNVTSLGSVVPKQLVEDTTKALSKLKVALGGDVSGYVACRLHMNMTELKDALAAEQVDGVALAMYNIGKRAQSVIIGDQTGIGKGRQAAAMIRYGLLSGYLPVFFTDRSTLFSDMYRDCKALGIKDARPLVVNAGASVVDFDHIIEENGKEVSDEIWSPMSEEEDFARGGNIKDRRYHRLAGEVEAKNICIRHFLTTEQHRQKLYSDTQDVPDKRQFVLFQ